ncbi:MAG: histidinol-phosphate aminotransferase [Parcubacteria group bacterium]|nr:histidinol-phosphate aminotransferase [Parcubacteria group bacterium]
MEPNAFIQKLKEYPLASHKAWEAKDKSQVLKMDWNESDLALPESVRSAVADFIAHGPTHWYPDIANRALIESIARYTSMSPSRIQYFGGEDSALEYVVRTFVSPEDEVGLVAPTYDNFRVFVESVGAIPVFLYGNDLFSPDVATLKEKISPRMKMVYLVNPNNPTGTLYSLNDVEELLQAFPTTLFVVDEAYGEFAGTSVMPLVDRYSNLLVGRSFSKAFGLASFRLGYVVSALENIAHLNKIRNGKNIPALAQIAAIAALADPSYMTDYVKEVRATRIFLSQELQKLGIEAKETPANFILLRVPDPTGWCAALVARDVFIRNLGHLSGMEAYVRVTVGRRETAERFLAIVKDLIDHGKLATT